MQLKNLVNSKVLGVENIETKVFDDYIKTIEKELGRGLNNSDIEKIRQAIELAEIAYEGLYRKSGEPFINHPLEVARIVASLKLDVDSIVAAILHDAIEDSNGKVTYENIKNMFGEEISNIVDGVTKVSRINAPVGNTEQKKKIQTIQKMFFAMAEDVRVIFVKLADRLHNMRTMEYVQDEEKKRYKALETLEVYAPIAHKLGIHIIKSELEDLCFKVLNYEEYQMMKKLIAQKKAEREERIKQYIDQAASALKEHGIEAVVGGRYKHYYSIWKKMVEKGKDIDELFDLMGIRIVVNDITTCYTAVGIVHNLWVPLPGRFKDYIAAPKSNGYRSIHTTVITQYGEPLEVQIRDKTMHEEAEYGLIAHWAYKEGNPQVDVKQKWLLRLSEWRKEISQGYASIDDLTKELQNEEVFVLTPKGEIFHLPYGSTPIDFAYAIHTEIGHHFAGAKVNGKIVSVDYKLNNGDVVEIIVNKSSQGPSLDWLKYAKSSRTKAKIKRFFKEKNREILINAGRDVIRKIAKRFNTSIEELLEKEELKKYLSTHQIDVDEFLSRIGEKVLSYDDIIKLLGLKEVQKKKVEYKKKRTPKSLVRIDGQSTVEVLFAKCCNPIIGDPIVAVAGKRGLVVHRKNCKNIINIEKDRSYNAEWVQDASAKFDVVIKIEIEKREKVPEILSKIMEQGIIVSSIKLEEIKSTLHQIVSLTISVSSLEKLNEITNIIKNISGVIRVVRE